MTRNFDVTNIKQVFFESILSMMTI